MDISSSHSDPLRDAVQDAVYRAVQVGSFAMTSAQMYAYHRRAQARITAEQDHRARRALNAQVRAERDADRTRWAPPLDPAWLRNASLVETAHAWGAALPYADRNAPWDEPAAATAMTRCEERLRDCTPTRWPATTACAARTSAPQRRCAKPPALRPPPPASRRTHRATSDAGNGAAT